VTVSVKTVELVRELSEAVTAGDWINGIEVIQEVVGDGK
jgi:hypothetical protein